MARPKKMVNVMEEIKETVEPTSIHDITQIRAKINAKRGRPRKTTVEAKAIEEKAAKTGKKRQLTVILKMTPKAEAALMATRKATGQSYSAIINHALEFSFGQDGFDSLPPKIPGYILKAQELIQKFEARGLKKK